MSAEKLKVLIIDDDPNIQQMLGYSFLKRGFEFISAEDGEVGLRLFDEFGPDIVLVDLVMPKMDGFSVLQAIIERDPFTPVIVISGQGGMQEVIKSLRFGAWNYITKPIAMKVLDHNVDEALEKSRLRRENRDYRVSLEKKVQERTRELDEKNAQLQATLKNLEEEIAHRLNVAISLRESELKLSSIINSVEGFIFTCKNNQIEFMNASLVDFVGHDARGEKCHDVIFGMEQCPFCDENINSEGNPVKRDFRNPKDDRWYQVSHYPLKVIEGEISASQTILIDITERKKTEMELLQIEQELIEENMRLRASLKDRFQLGKLIGKSPPMQKVYELILRAAAVDANVIIYGESGTGKELVAQAIHENSTRVKESLVYVNCGAIPESLIESEFFGYKKGAFTGAGSDKLGFLDIADHGTLFLDEIGEIGLSMQVKLLRAIEGKGYTPVGGIEVKTPDVRVIAATNRDLKDQVKKGEMRHDFLYRIHIIPIYVPPLRERKEDIPLLVDHFLKQDFHDERPLITGKVMDLLLKYDWPGNVRELQNTVHRFVTLGNLDFMGMEIPEGVDETHGLTVDISSKVSPLRDVLDRVEEQVIRRALQENNWQKGKVARQLHIDHKTLTKKINQYGIHPQ
ncbi:sigma 54-interacting transcriptional regulator [Thermodesulfobacteriota bacterium]